MTRGELIDGLRAVFHDLMSPLCGAAMDTCVRMLYQMLLRVRMCLRMMGPMAVPSVQLPRFATKNACRVWSALSFMCVWTS